MKPFNLEEAKAGKPVCTTAGNKVRILCFDLKNTYYPIVAAILMENNEEALESYTNEGYLYNQRPNKYNLCMVGEKHTGYINIYKNSLTKASNMFLNKEYAEKIGKTNKDYITTIQIEWEE